MADALPPEICPDCRAEIAAIIDHWVTDVLCYCPHRQVLCRRPSTSDAWVIDRDVPPKKAQSLLWAAMARLGAELAAKDISLKQASDHLMQLRELRKRSPLH